MPPAIVAFLRGLERRAALLARVQAGDANAGRRALDVTARVFAEDASRWPLAQWPGQYWRLLLSAPAMAGAGSAAAHTELPGIARLPPARRAAVLLLLVAGLEDTDAAAALGIDTRDLHQRVREALPRDALGQPDLDVWRAWQAACKRALEAVPLAADSAPPATAADTARAAGGSARRRLRWRWLAAGLCVAALVAGVLLHPRGRALLDALRGQVQREALPPAAAPKARFDPADPALHPDRALLVAPAELALARQLSLLAWLAASPEIELPAAAATPASAAPSWPQALQQWQRLPAAQRAAQRQAWAQWQALTDAERTLLRATALRLANLPEPQQQALRARHAALPFDARHGWLLGPQLGRDWPRIAALFADVASDQRDALLQLLRSCSAEQIDALARLAQTTPPQDRASLRRALLAQPPALRTAWLQDRLQH